MPITLTTSKRTIKLFPYPTCCQLSSEFVLHHYAFNLFIHFTLHKSSFWATHIFIFLCAMRTPPTALLRLTNVLYLRILKGVPRDACFLLLSESYKKCFKRPRSKGLSYSFLRTSLLLCSNENTLFHDLFSNYAFTIICSAEFVRHFQGTVVPPISTHLYGASA